MHHANVNVPSQGVAEQLDGTIARDVKILREHITGGGTFETASLMWTKDAPTGRKPYALTRKSGNMFRVGIFLDFVWLTTRTPHGAYVRRARRNRIDRHGG